MSATPAPHDPLAEVAARYAVAITPAMAALTRVGRGPDPIAAQFLPDARELLTLPDELADPTADGPFTPVKGVVHRHPDRVLLKPVHVCPVYCRFCFRREVVGPDGEGSLSAAELEAALDYIAAEPAIWEVILTGGDPFVLSPRRAAVLTTRLAAIDHVQVVRWHTRVPLVDPDRVSPALVQALRGDGVTTWVALHANHPAEFTAAGSAAIARLVDAGIPLVSQTVLLAGVNDDAATLEALMRTFVRHRIKPYYLHHLDPAPGTSHFRVPAERGLALMDTLHQRASGLCQPRYVIDQPFAGGKVAVGGGLASKSATVNEKSNSV
jgi:lysine 2,3-aminomutase